MEIGTNFVDCFEIDLTSIILGFLSNPADLIRASAVSRSWCHFVIANGLCKKLWLKKVPQVAKIEYAVEEGGERKLTILDIVSRNSVNWETLTTEHIFYSSLLHPLSKQIICPEDCLGPGVLNTNCHPVFDLFVSVCRVNKCPPGGPYWSIRGESDPNPWGIMYRLNTPICIVSEVNILPPKGQSSRQSGAGKTVYSENLVRFRIGHPKSLAVEKMMVTSPTHMPSVDNYVWIYTSPLFPMIQEPAGQLKFKLPEPVVCVSGILHIEMFGRSRKEEMDALLFIFWSYVRVLGHSLEPLYSVRKLPSGEFLLNYSPHFLDGILGRISGFGSKSADEPEK